MSKTDIHNSGYGGYGLRAPGYGLRAWWCEVTNAREIVEEMGGAACRVADQDRGGKLTPSRVLRSPRRVSAQTAPLRQSSGSGIRTGNAVLQRSAGGCVRAGAPGRARGGERVDWTVTFTATTSSGSAPCSQGRCETCAPFSFARAPDARERHGKARSLESGAWSPKPISSTARYPGMAPGTPSSTTHDRSA